MEKKSFIYSIPTKVYFGQMYQHIGKVITKYGHKALFLYDGDYIKTNGLYQKILDEFEKYQIHFIEFRDIKPNPRHTDLNQAVKICQENAIEVILAVGGGSVIDSAKVIGASFFAEGDCWDLVSGKCPYKKTLPVIAVSTISATGSEMDNAAVITNEALNEKLVLANDDMYPVAAFLNPELTYTVSKFQTACGIADILAHILEEYFTPTPGLYMIDSMMEGLIRTLFEYGPIAYQNPTDYEARANIMWTASWAINGFVAFDRPHKWSMHPLGHGLSAYYDITHGLSLAIIMPRWLEFVKDKDSLPLFRSLGIHAFMLDASLSDEDMANKVIRQIEYLLFDVLELKSTLTALNITDEYFSDMADKLCGKEAYYDGFRKLSREDIICIYKNCLSNRVARFQTEKKSLNQF